VVILSRYPRGSVVFFSNHCFSMKNYTTVFFFFSFFFVLFVCFARIVIFNYINIFF
jgi:hypothetical protein